MSKKATQYRSAISGRFVTKQNAKSHPKTTVAERNSVGQRKRRAR